MLPAARAVLAVPDWCHLSRAVPQVLTAPWVLAVPDWCHLSRAVPPAPGVPPARLFPETPTVRGVLAVLDWCHLSRAAPQVLAARPHLAVLAVRPSPVLRLSPWVLARRLFPETPAARAVLAVPDWCHPILALPAAPAAPGVPPAP